MSTMHAVIVDPPGRGSPSAASRRGSLARERCARGRALAQPRRATNRARFSRPGSRPAATSPAPSSRQPPTAPAPPVGTRVVGMVDGGTFAEQVAVRTDSVAALPDAVSFRAGRNASSPA